MQSFRSRATFFANGYAPGAVAAPAQLPTVESMTSSFDTQHSAIGPLPSARTPVPRFTVFAYRLGLRRLWPEPGHTEPQGDTSY